jgi:hypothetical protein
LWYLAHRRIVVIALVRYELNGCERQRSGGNRNTDLLHG